MIDTGGIQIVAAKLAAEFKSTKSVETYPLSKTPQKQDLGLRSAKGPGSRDLDAAILRR
jgi:hypothetical protein